MAVDTQSYGGTAQLTIAGTTYQMAGKFSSVPGGKDRTPAVGPSGPTGKYTEAWKPAKVTTELWDDPTISWTTVANATRVPILIMLDNGKIWRLRNGFCTNAGSFEVSDGKVTLEWSGLFTETPAH